MSRLATSFVLGYHGCDAKVARAFVSGSLNLKSSDNNYDWLGPGIYFWESDPVRAMEFAQWKVRRGDYKKPAVVGAIIDLRNCFDLIARESVKVFQKAHHSFVLKQQKAGLPIPKNENPFGFSDEDRLLRYLDCAVFRDLHNMIKSEKAQSFDTVRGMFVEGERAFGTSGIYSKSHIQIAVCNPSCIKGLFFPLNEAEL